MVLVQNSYALWPFGQSEEAAMNAALQPLLQQEKALLTDLKLKLDQHCRSGELILTKGSLFSPFFSLLGKEFLALSQRLASMSGQATDIEGAAQDIFYSLPSQTLAEAYQQKDDVSQALQPYSQSSLQQQEKEILARDKKTCSKVSRTIALHIGKISTPLPQGSSKFEVVGRLALCNIHLLKAFIDIFRLVEEEYALYTNISPDEFVTVDLAPLVEQLDYLQTLQETINYERQAAMQSEMMAAGEPSVYSQWLSFVPSAAQILLVMGGLGATVLYLNYQYIAPIKAKMRGREERYKGELAAIETRINENRERDFAALRKDIKRLGKTVKTHKSGLGIIRSELEEHENSDEHHLTVPRSRGSVDVSPRKYRHSSSSSKPDSRELSPLAAPLYHSSSFQPKSKRFSVDASLDDLKSSGSSSSSSSSKTKKKKKKEKDDSKKRHSLFGS